ncbi:breast carcinoma-amplified sequence 3 homolog isoform X2 [Arctopsyche grandis]
MSAESPRRSRVGGPLLVAPQPPSDRSLMDTVSGFINDVTLTSSPGVDPKDIIQWARFETADLNEPKSESDCDGDIQPLLLVVGYGSGIQVWVIHPGGEAQEALSWRQGSVRVLRLLPTPSYGDHYSQKRPLIALCDSTGPGSPYCSLSFISLVGGDQVKSIKFKNPILDVVANKRSIVVSFAERLAVFDACKLEDRLTVTTCYPSPCPLGGLTPLNPLSLGDRWLAYAERRISPTKRSSGGCEGEGVASYTATVLHAAKSLGKGLRGLGESVASSLGGARSGGLSQSPSPPHSEQLQPGVVTIIDLETWKLNEDDGADLNDESSSTANDSVVAHFVAHSEPIVAIKFDASGMLLVTADKRGHDFHVFRIHPHPSGPNLASVHHLYILHRGDTTAKVQDMSISFDSRWVAVSTLRGTTHVFPITPYGGAVGVRTHASPHVVNRLSRFHRSAGLAADGRSNSPVGENLVSAAWYPNPRLPPFPAPCTLHPLSQLRPSPICGAAPTIPTHTITRNSSGRQRLSSLSEEGQLPLVVCAQWGTAARGVAGVTRARGLPSPPATQALYVMSAHGNLVQYYVNPRHVSGVPKEKVCDDTSIELDVEPKAQWPLLRPQSSNDIMAPLPSHHILVKPIHPNKDASEKEFLDAEDRWLSQVEIMTHAGPHRRLWMGPQFVFKTYNAASGTSLSLLDFDAVEVGTGPAVARSNPVNMPGARPIVPVLIESGSASSLEHSPRLSDAYRKVASRDGNNISLKDGEADVGHREGEVRLKEDLAEAMRDTDQGCEWAMGGWSKGDDCRAPHVHRIVNPLGTVVSGTSSTSPSPPSEEDSHILSNEDEALFRPVVRAPRSLPAPTAPPTKPLSSRTLLPAQQISAINNQSVDVAPAASLTDHVVIPAKLSFTVPEPSKDYPELDMEMDIDEPPPPPPPVAKRSSVPKETTPPDTKKKSGSKKHKEEKLTKQSTSAMKLSKKEPIISNKKPIENLPLESDSFAHDLLKAVDQIQFCNDELVENLEIAQNTHITSHEASVEKSSLKAVINDTEVFSDDSDSKILRSMSPLCFDSPKPEIKREIVDVKACSELMDALEDTVISTSTQGLKDNKSNVLDDIVSVEDSPWELLTETKQRQVESDSADVYQLVEDCVSIKSSTADDGKQKAKKGKKNKPKFRTVLKAGSPARTFDTNVDVVPDEPKESPPSVGISWSDIAKRSAASEELTSSKESTVYNESNIVVAVCDAPMDLCFVDEHHSFFQEPPPLEPINLTLDDVRLEVMHDSFLDYQSSKDALQTSTRSDKSESCMEDDDKVALLETSATFERELSKSVEKSGPMEKSDAMEKSGMMEKSGPMEKSGQMEKSSDEEIVSPSESDDGTIAVQPEEKDVEQSRDSPLISLNPPAVNKSNSSKKKPKRKRR